MEYYADVKSTLFRTSTIVEAIMGRGGTVQYIVGSQRRRSVGEEVSYQLYPTSQAKVLLWHQVQ